MDVKSRTSGLHFRLNLRVTGFEWPNAVGSNAIPNEQLCLAGDSFPICSRVLAWTRSDEECHLNAEYVPGGIQLSYSPPAMAAGAFKVPDTMKLAFFSSHPRVMATECKSNPEYMSTYRGNEPLYAPLAAGFFPMQRLQECMRGDRTSLDLQFTHNFAQTTLHVSLSDAVVTVGGKQYDSGAAWVPELRTICSRSMLHDMEQRSKIIAENCSAFGSATLQCATPRPNSIGELLMCPMTALPMEGEALPMTLLGEYFRSDTSAVCATYGAHYAVHAHACMGVRAEVDEPEAARDACNGALQAHYAEPRNLDAKTQLRLLHTALIVPQMSNELTPYVSDVTACPGPMLTQKLKQGDPEGLILSRADFVGTECVDPPMCAPNDFVVQGNDCEGGTARLMHRLMCTRAMVKPAINAMRAARLEAQNAAKDGSTTVGPALAAYIKNDCHAEIDMRAQFAYASQMFALGLLAQEAVSLSNVTVGAHCATPLQRVQLDSQVNEVGHSCGALNIDTTRAEYVVGKAREYSLALMRGDAPDTLQLSTGRAPVRVLNHEGAEGSVFHSIYNMTGVPRTMPLCDITGGEREFWIVESTNAVSPCPLTGELTVQTSALGTAQQEMLRKMGKNSIQLQLSEVLQATEMSCLDNFIGDDHANVRCTGFVNSKSLKRNTDFYHTFYTLDRCVLNQVVNNGAGDGHTYTAGVDAMDFLFNTKKANMTIENFRMPLLSEEHENLLLGKLRAQWAETRMPSIGADAVLKATRKMQPATGARIHCPEDPAMGTRRCNIVISGSSAIKLLDEMKYNEKFRNTLQTPKRCTGSSPILASDVFQLGCNSVVVSHTVHVAALCKQNQ